MGGIERELIRTALIRKGFKEKSNDHKFYFFYFKDKKQPIFTKLSHGTKYKTYSNELLSKISKQLRLTKKELLKLIDCDICEADYIKLLVERGHLKH